MMNYTEILGYEILTHDSLPKLKDIVTFALKRHTLLPLNKCLDEVLDLTTEHMEEDTRWIPQGGVSTLQIANNRATNAQAMILVRVKSELLS